MLLYVWQALHPMEIKCILLKGHGTSHGFSFAPISLYCLLSQSPLRIFGTSAELLFPRLLVLSYAEKTIKNCFYFQNSAYNTDEHGNSSSTKFFRVIDLWQFCDTMILEDSGDDQLSR